MTMRLSRAKESEERKRVEGRGEGVVCRVSKVR